MSGLPDPIALATIRSHPMTNPYSIDIYRTEDAILIHDRPGGWKRAIVGLLMGSVGLGFP